MPLRTETYAFDAEIDRIDEQVDHLAEDVAGLDADNPLADQLTQQAVRLDAQRRGLTWARDEWGVDEVTLSGLTGGEHARLEDRFADGGGGPGATRVWKVAAGTEDAPYVTDDLESTVALVAELPIAYQKWAFARINELTSVGEGNLSAFERSVMEKRHQAASNDE